MVRSIVLYLGLGHVSRGAGMGEISGRYAGGKQMSCELLVNELHCERNNVN